MAPPDRADPGQLVLQPRDVRFDWSGLPLTWIPGEPATSHVINVLHLLLPEGERWFVTVFKRALPLIGDEALREDVLGFIGQAAARPARDDPVGGALPAPRLPPFAGVLHPGCRRLPRRVPRGAVSPGVP